MLVLGLSIHNSADGFVLGVGAKAAAVTAVGALDLGVLVHQVPVGGALAAVLVAAQARMQATWTVTLPTSP